ncbi:DUF3472 domain-containing protein [Olivibacter ginsenosidimutans]
MQHKIFLLLLSLIFSIGGSTLAQEKAIPNDAIDVPIGGNTWQVAAVDADRDVVGTHGIPTWNDPSKAFVTYVRLAKKGSLALWLKARVDGPGILTVQVSGKQQQIDISPKHQEVIYLGDWDIRDTGYIAINLQAKKEIHLSKLTAIAIAGSAVSAQTHFVKDNEGNFFYWGRRGPSTHLNYQTPEGKDIAYYYNEVTVPKENDIIGSYFMANGFEGGYFGMQVNTATERRILFSVWSPFQTDNPNEIPEDHRIKLLKKGEDVHGGEFGGEGSGGQSYWRFNWKAGHTYKFLLKGEPVANQYTNYTAWFFAPEIGKWKLIASFSRPQTNSWLHGFHSFLENFSPKQGILERKVYFGNQWVIDKEGNYYEIREAKFSADNTARKGYRLDYSGGNEKEKFFLHNFGFFSHYTPIGTSVKRFSTANKPLLNLEQLPQK